MGQLLRIHHRTEYRYDRPVAFGPHKLMLRPRDGHDLWVEDAYLTISPQAETRWFFDVFGNSVAEATFHEPADTLRIDSELYIRRYPVEARVRDLAGRSQPYPFEYSDEESIDLLRYLVLQNPDEAGVIGEWLADTFPRRPRHALDVPRKLADAIHDAIGYSAREEMGTQSAAETIARGQGTCRDFAFLFMEAARLCGYAARFVTGYLYDADGAVGGGATHAWADVYVPGEGWIEFDPTNRIVGGGELIRVATTRAPSQASPISGSYSGADAAFLGLEVEVTVEAVDAAGTGATG